MIQTKDSTNIDRPPKSNRFTFTVESQVIVEKQFFDGEIEICVAYCGSLFEAGVVTRLESEKLINGLKTIKKRSEFDDGYFSETDAKNIYAFIEQKLRRLIGDVASKLNIGRNHQERTSSVLRFWLKKEIFEISQILREIQQSFIKIAEENQDVIFLTETAGLTRQPIFFVHWCLSQFEAFQKDRERLDEVWRRVDTLPIGSGEGLGTSLEFDREELAATLGFSRISTNSLYSIHNQDFILEFANVASLLTIQFSHLLEDLSRYRKDKFLNFNPKISSEQLDLLHGKLKKVFAYQTEISGNLQSKTLSNNSGFNGNTEAILGLVELIKKSLATFNFVFRNTSLNHLEVNRKLERIAPSVVEIAEYLMQRNENFTVAKECAIKINADIFEANGIKNIRLEDLKEISTIIESDFFVELSIETILNSKNQIGGTSHERVLEALEDAKRALHFEE